MNVHVTTGQRLFKDLQNVLESLSLDINNVREQGYDNGSNMKYKHHGVQRKLLNIDTKTLYEAVENTQEIRNLNCVILFLL